KDLERDPGTGTTSVGFAVTGPVTFDALGRVESQAQAFFDTSPEIVFAANPPPNLPRTTYGYDVLSRQRRVVTPDGGRTTTDYDIQVFDGVLRFAKTVRDPNQNALPAGTATRERVSFLSARDEVVG